MIMVKIELLTYCHIYRYSYLEQKKKETKTKFVTVILTNTARIEKLITVKTEILIFWYTYIAREKCMLMVTISDNGVLVIKM